MGARLNRVPAEHFAPIDTVFVDRHGKEYTAMPGKRRIIPKDKRVAIYQMLLLVRETEAEISAVFDEFGIRAKTQRAKHRKRIYLERGK